MAIAVRATSNAKVDSGTTLAVTKPAGTAAGDLLVAIVWQDSDAPTHNWPAAQTAPGGWAQAGANITAGGASPVGKVWWDVAGASEPGSYTFNLASNSSALILLMAISGANTSSPISVAPAAGGGSGAAQTAPSIGSGSTPAAGDLLIVSFSAQGGAITWSGFTAGLTDRGGATTSWVSGEFATQVLSAAGPTGSKSATAAGPLSGSYRSLALAISGTVAKSGAATATLLLGAAADGAKSVTGAVTELATLRLGATAGGVKRAAGSGGLGSGILYPGTGLYPGESTFPGTGGVEALLLGAGAIGAKGATGAVAAAPLVLAASATGQKLNVVVAALRLTASLSSTGRPGSGQVTATLLLTADATSAPRAAAGQATATLRLGATPAATSTRAQPATADPLHLTATPAGAKAGVGAPAAAVLLLAATVDGLSHDGTGTPDATLLLAASVAGTTRDSTPSPVTAVLLLGADTAATRTGGNEVTATLWLSARAEAQHIVTEVPSQITARAQITVPYELVAVARIPQTSGAPTLIEVDPIDWTGLSYVDELSKPQQLNAGCKISNLTEPVLQRLRKLSELATELWLYRDGRLVFAGALAGWQVQGEGLSLQAVGLLGYLRLMAVDTDLVYKDVDQFKIATGLIDQWQSLPYGNFGIDTTGIAPSGVTRDATYLAKELHNVGQRVAELGLRQNGFDLTVDPASRKLKLSYPLQGVDRSSGEDAIVFDARNVTSPNIVCSAAPGDVASEAYGTGTSSGGGDTLRSVKSNLDLRTRFGRSAITATFDSVSEQATLDAHTQGLLDARDEALLIPGPDVRVTPDADLAAWDVGDTISYQLHSQLSVSGAFRLRKRTVTVSQTGQESCSVQFV